MSSIPKVDDDDVITFSLPSSEQENDSILGILPYSVAGPEWAWIC